MKERKQQEPVKQSRFPASLFAIFWITLSLMSGVHIGIIVLMNRLQLNDVVQCVVPMVYWGLVAAVITFVTRKQIRDSYDEPMHKLAEATKKVANGDFSVYMPTCHTADKLDYLDRMILDFNKMVEELGSIETLKTDFVSNVSHEMKTPIAIIKNYAEMLQAEEVSRERRMEYAAAMEDASIRLSSLISNILKLNRLENQRITPEVEVYDVCRQLCDCILPFEEVWEARRIEMEIDLEDEAMVLADQSLLELVWNNLLSNALKFTEPGGTVTVRQISEDGYVKIFVADTGCGMKKESIRHIFDKFYQGDTSHAKEGNGLGLALVKRVLELLNGDIHVTSEEGVGSTFTVVLPAVQNETMEEPGNGGE